MPTAICDGIETRYEVAGGGPPLLLFSPGGFNATIENWTAFGIYRRLDLLRRLTQEYTCITFDKRESGRSGGRIEHVTWSDYARQGCALLDHLGIERAHVVGLGDAGIPTFNFGREHPDRCLSLTSICLGPRYRVPPYWLNERILNPLTERFPLDRIIPDRVVRAMVVKATSGGRLPPHLVAHMVDNIDHQMLVHKYSVLPVTHAHEMRDWAGSLDVPTLLINRDDDPLAPVEETRELAALLPRCHGVEIFEDGGRFLTYSRADEINRLLRDFFAAVAP
jgi:pimeloyl-ACP methyl ester carboxylesterase